MSTVFKIGRQISVNLIRENHDFAFDAETVRHFVILFVRESTGTTGRAHGGFAGAVRKG
jgi:hypothetical protein